MQKLPENIVGFAYVLSLQSTELFQQNLPKIMNSITI